MFLAIITKDANPSGNHPASEHGPAAVEYRRPDVGEFLARSGPLGRPVQPGEHILDHVLRRRLIVHDQRGQPHELEVMAPEQVGEILFLSLPWLFSRHWRTLGSSDA